MRQIKEILILIKEEFNRRGYYSGLCFTANYLQENNKISVGELRLWENYWDAYSKTRKVFYDAKGKTLEPYMFGWKLGLKPPRNNWLDKHIKLNS